MEPSTEPSAAAVALRAHFGDCVAARGHWHGLGGVIELMHAALRPRLISTLVVLLVLLAGALWLA